MVAYKIISPTSIVGTFLKFESRDLPNPKLFSTCFFPGQISNWQEYLKALYFRVYKNMIQLCRESLIDKPFKPKEL